MSNRIAWIMGTLAMGAALAALGVGLNGYRTTPPAPVRPANPLSGPVEPGDTDPMAPRLFDRSGPIRIHVAGAVRKPGVYSLPSWARVVDAVKKAGGATSAADLDTINLADRLRDGEQLRIPHRGRREVLSAHRPTPEPPAVPRSAGGHALGRYPFAAVAGSSSTRRTGGGPVNLNTAGAPELESLPGIGPATATKILAYRREHGPFLRKEDLILVPGIGPARSEALRDLVTVD